MSYVTEIRDIDGFEDTQFVRIEWDLEFIHRKWAVVNISIRIISCTIIKEDGEEVSVDTENVKTGPVKLPSNSIGLHPIEAEQVKNKVYINFSLAAA